MQIRLTLGAVMVGGALLSACGSGDGGSGGSGGGSTLGSSSSSSGGLSSSSSGGVDPKQSTCEAAAKKAVACCPSGVPNCQPDTEQDWVNWCLQWWDFCPQSFECQVATDGCDTDQCPNVGNGGCG